MHTPDINALLDDLLTNDELQRSWELEPEQVASRYSLTPGQLQALLEGDVEQLISEGLAERHMQQMRVSW